MEKVYSIAYPIVRKIIPEARAYVEWAETPRAAKPEGKAYEGVLTNAKAFGKKLDQVKTYAKAADSYVNDYAAYKDVSGKLVSSKAYTEIGKVGAKVGQAVKPAEEFAAKMVKAAVSRFMYTLVR